MVFDATNIEIRKQKPDDLEVEIILTISGRRPIWHSLLFYDGECYLISDFRFARVTRGDHNYLVNNIGDIFAFPTLTHSSFRNMTGPQNLIYQIRHVHNAHDVEISVLGHCYYAKAGCWKTDRPLFKEEIVRPVLFFNGTWYFAESLTKFYTDYSVPIDSIDLCEPVSLLDVNGVL